MQADLLFGFLGSILDTEHTALLPPVGWFHWMIGGFTLLIKRIVALIRCLAPPLP